MRRAHRIAIAAIASGLVSKGAAAQGIIELRADKPVMMLLVDTSGSMERKPNGIPDINGVTSVDALPSTSECTGDPAVDSLYKTRWAVTLEALTGSINNYTCDRMDRSTDLPETAYDYGYHLPHFDFTQNLSQNADGLLDAYALRIKFGLMTFDGVGTTIGGDPLVAYDTWSTSSFLDDANGGPGMYSYGRVGKLSFPGCESVYGINSGARGPDADVGALISVGADGDATVTNQLIQNALLAVRPYGGTPIAGMLDDLDYYLTNDDDVKPASGGVGDSRYACRERYAVLITDGAPDKMFRDSRFNCQSTADTQCAEDKCSCPYELEKDIARDLVSSDKLDKLFVLAFDVSDPTALQTLNEIADAGGSDEARSVSTPDALRTELSSIFDGSSDQTSSRSIPITVNGAQSVLLGGTQYRINAGFKIDKDTSKPWSGLLYRRRIQCNGAAAEEVELNETAEQRDFFHLQLNEQLDANRSIFTVLPPTDGSQRGTLLLADAESELRRDDLPFNGANFTDNTQRPRGGTISSSFTADSSRSADQARIYTDTRDEDSLDAKTRFDNSLPSAFFKDCDGNSIDGEDGDRTKIVEFVRATSTDRADRKLGAIIHSNPTALPPLTSYSDSLIAPTSAATAWHRQLVAEYATQGGRPGALFVGTNDGMLHAFLLEDWDNREAGEELWAFVPPALYDGLAAASLPQAATLFDGTPIVTDVVLKHELEAANAAPHHATVLVAALRGAAGFVALDVTYPERPKFLWQFSDEYMGLTVGDPAVTHVMMDWNGTLQQRAVAILPGGSGLIDSTPDGDCGLLSGDYEPMFENAAQPGTKRAQVRCWQNRGRMLYVVDIATGELIQRFDARHFRSPLTGSVAADAGTLEIARAAYFSDQDGILWRLSMLSQDPTEWVVQPLIDMFEGITGSNAYKIGRPAAAAPLIAKDANLRNVILVGTGDMENLADNTAKNRVISLTESRDDNIGGELGGEITFNWSMALDPGESVTGPLVKFREAVYFGTFTTGSSAVCELGTSKLWGVHYNEALDATGDIARPMLNDPNFTDPVLNMQVEDAENESDGAIVLGVTIARQPVCAEGTLSAIDPNNAAGPMARRYNVSGAVGGGAFQLTAMVAGGGGQAIAGTDGLNQVQQTIPTTILVRRSSMAGSVE